MNDDINNWEDAFSAFEKDFSLQDKEKEPEDIPADVPEKNEPLPEEPEGQPEPATVEEQEEASVFTFDDEEPEPEKDPLTTNDVEKTATLLADGIEAAKELSDTARRMITEHTDIRLPKGLRTASANLKNIYDILVASKSIIDLFLEMGVEPLYQSIDDSRLKTTVSNTIRTLMAHVPSLTEGLHDVEESMDENYDRPSANLRVRIVKGQTHVLMAHAKEQAVALAQTIEAFPLENGALRLLCLVEEKGDKDMMQSMDNALRLADAVQVPVADAPAMLEAVQRNDQKTVDAIVRRMIENE